MNKQEITAARKYVAACKAELNAAETDANLAYLSEDDSDLSTLNHRAKVAWETYQEALTHLPVGEGFKIEVKENGRVR